LLLVSLWGVPLAQAFTLLWTAPQDFTLAPRQQYGIWQRRVGATSYVLLKRVDAPLTQLNITPPPSTSGKTCYQVRAILWDTVTKTIVEQSPPTPVRNLPNCTALCYAYTAPPAALAPDECYQP
jgi:hypothetical protein